MIHSKQWPDSSRVWFPQMKTVKRERDGSTPQLQIGPGFGWVTQPFPKNLGLVHPITLSTCAAKTLHIHPFSIGYSLSRRCQVLPVPSAWWLIQKVMWRGIATRTAAVEPCHPGDFVVLYRGLQVVLARDLKDYNKAMKSGCNYSISWNAIGGLNLG